MLVINKGSTVSLFHSNAPARLLCAVFGFGALVSLGGVIWSLFRGNLHGAEGAAVVAATCALGLALNAFYPEVSVIFDARARDVAVRSRLPLALHSPSQRKIPFGEIRQIVRRRDGGEIDNVFVSLRLNSGETIQLGEGTLAETDALTEAERMLRPSA